MDRATGLFRRWAGFAATAALGITLVGVPAAHAGGASQTGQGIMVNLDAAGDFAIVETDTYEFDVTAASAYFTNAWDGNAPTVTCTGPGCGTAPAAPSAPTPDASKVSGPSGLAHTQRCIFLDGGDLAGTNYTQSVKVSTGSGKTGATYTYVYTYNATPTQSVAPFTAWNLVDTHGGGLAHVAIAAEIAGESVVKSSNAKIGTKFSFSMVEGDGTNRVQNLAVTVTNAATGESTTANPGSTVNFPVDFTYATNAGSNGATGLLKNGDARTILNTDSFAGNNDGGADGSALAKVSMDATPFDLGAGDYNVTLTGTVKGNNALADVPFTVTQIVHVIAKGCGAV
jgi:hypothetical protein